MAKFEVGQTVKQMSRDKVQAIVRVRKIWKNGVVAIEDLKGRPMIHTTFNSHGYQRGRAMLHSSHLVALAEGETVKTIQAEKNRAIEDLKKAAAEKDAEHDLEVQNWWASEGEDLWDKSERIFGTFQGREVRVLRFTGRTFQDQNYLVLVSLEIGLDWKGDSEVTLTTGGLSGHDGNTNSVSISTMRGPDLAHVLFDLVK